MQGKMITVDTPATFDSKSVSATATDPRINRMRGRGKGVKKARSKFDPAINALTPTSVCACGAICNLWLFWVCN